VAPERVKKRHYAADTAFFPTFPGSTLIPRPGWQRHPENLF